MQVGPNSYGKKISFRGKTLSTLENKAFDFSLLLVTGVFFLLHVLLHARVMELIVPAMGKYLEYGIIMLIPIIFIFYIKCNSVKVIISSVLLFIYFIMLMYMGDYFNQLKFSAIQMTQFSILLLIPEIYMILRRGLERWLTVIFCVICLIYFPIYIYLSHKMPAAATTLRYGSGLIAAQDQRGPRLFLEENIAGIGLFIGISAFRNRKSNIFTVLILVLSICCIIYSRSRIFEATMVFISIVYIVFGHTPKIIRLYNALWIIGAACSLYFIAAGVNPYSAFKNDGSIQSRSYEYINAVKVFTHNETFGVGMYSPTEEMVKQKHFKFSGIFWDDIGIYGILYSGGIIGLLIFSAMSLITINSYRYFNYSGMTKLQKDYFYSNCVFIGAFSFITSYIWNVGLETIVIVVPSLFYSYRVKRQNNGLLD